MRRVIEFDIADVFPSDADVLHRLGTPRRAAGEISPMLQELLDDAKARIAKSAAPRGVIAEITPHAFEAVYRGAGKNADETPIQIVAAQAEAMALFVGTIGAETEHQIHALFRDHGDPAVAVVLDSFASEMTNCVAERLAARFLADLQNESRVTATARALPYSPGYCGWHVSGQRALFAKIEPAELGVSLGRSCLMKPLKSVSGVIAIGDRDVHRFRPQWTFCNECVARDCGPRMASVR